MMALNEERVMLKTITKSPLGTGILAFRDLQRIIRSHISGTTALDFGCGSGRSSRFLEALKFKVTAVDISTDLLDEAKAWGDSCTYILMNRGDFSFLHNQKFDLIMVSFVLMEISNLPEIVSMLNQLKSHLRYNGKIIVIAASNDLYVSDWLSLSVGSSENYSAGSGDIVSLWLKDFELEVKDYFWKERDCELCFKQAELSVLGKFAPLGQMEDNKPWIDEWDKAPFVIYLLEQ